MPEKLFIEWDRDRVIAAVGSATSQAVSIRSAFVVDRMDGALQLSEIADELRSGLRDNSLTATEAVAVFPRELVTFHRLTLPNLSDDELPAIVRLQAATRLTAGVDSACLDFAPLPLSPDSETRDVLLVTLPQKHVNEVREVLRALSIELTGARVSAFGIAASVVRSGLLQGTSPPNDFEAVIALGADSIEMIFMHGQHVFFSHSGASWTSREGIEQAVRSEVSRARMAAAEDIGQYKVSRLTIIGSPEITQAVPDSISKRLNDAPIARVSPSDCFVSGYLPDELTASDMLAIAGAIANSESTSVQAVDLINPRKAAEKKDYSRLIKIAIGGGLALLLVGVWSWRNSRITSINRDTASIKADIEDMKDDLSVGKSDLLLNSRLTEWTDRDISWVAELQRLQTLMEGTERIYVRQVRANSDRKGNQLGVIDIDGYAKDRRDIEDFARVLNDAGYDVSPTEMPLNPRDPTYQYEMSLEVIIPASA